MITFQKYVKAESLEEAYTLNQVKNNKILGGMLWMRQGNVNYNTVIDLSGLGLNQLTEDETQFTIGAMVSLRELETNESLNTYTNNAVRDALKDIIGVQFRNLATVGGSLWGRFGFSDVLTVLLSLDTYVELYKGGIVSLNEFSQMPYDNDILVNIIIKKEPCHCVYEAVRIQRTDFPVLTCAISQTPCELRFAIGARPGKALLHKESIDPADVTNDKISDLAASLSQKIPTSGNHRGSAEYRSRLISVLVQRGLEKLGGLS